MGQYTLEDLVNDLQRLRADSGRPSLRKLAKESSKLTRELQKERGWDLPDLSVTTLSNVLKRRRVNPPSWVWVATFVLTCQRIAAQAPESSVPPTEDLQWWRIRWNSLHVTQPLKMREDGESTAPAVVAGEERDRGPSHGRGAPGISSSERRPDPAPPPPSGPPLTKRSFAADRRRVGGEPPGGESAVCGVLTPTQERMVDAYGVHGLELIAAAEDHHEPDASYRIGLLLLLDGDHHEGLAWLMKAETDGRHPLATEFIELGTMGQAIEQACELGDFAVAEKDLMAAAVYYQRAAWRGHAEAAYKLGTVYERLGNRLLAAHWYQRAGAAGHEDGQAQFEQLFRSLRDAGFVAGPIPESRPARQQSPDSTKTPPTGTPVTN
jgi:hypothetical protein